MCLQFLSEISLQLVYLTEFLAVRSQFMFPCMKYDRKLFSQFEGDSVRVSLVQISGEKWVYHLIKLDLDGPLQPCGLPRDGGHFNCTSLIYLYNQNQSVSNPTFTSVLKEIDRLCRDWQIICTASVQVLIWSALSIS